MPAVGNLLGRRKPSPDEIQAVAINKFARDSVTRPKLTRAVMDQVTTPNLVPIMRHKDH